jgi:hypothetical protein
MDRFALLGLVICIAEAAAPVAEIGGYDEDRGWIREVRSKQIPVTAFGGRSCGTDKDGD